MNRLAAGELPDLLIWKTNLEQLRRSSSIRREHERASIGEEGALQEISGMVDRRMIRHLVHAHSLHRGLQHDPHFLPSRQADAALQYLEIRTLDAPQQTAVNLDERPQ